MISIREPIWKNRSVGLAEHSLEDDTYVEITYKNKEGRRLYPNKYKMRKTIVQRFPTQMVKGNKLYIVPISALEEIKGDE